MPVKSEEGLTLRFDTDFDMSGFTELAVVIEKPDRETVTATGTLGTATVTVTLDQLDRLGNSEDMEVDQYIEVTTATDLLDQTGTYKARAKYVDGTKLLFSKLVSFKVDP